MTGILTKHLVEKQIPYHVREANPLFTKFLEYYYEFQQNSKIPDIIQEIKKYNDIDSVEEQFLLEFFEEFKRLPSAIVADRRLVAKHVYDLYKAKGSEEALRLLFRIVYGEEISVYYPETDILRASDGRWVQKNIVTATKISGEVKTTSDRIEFDTFQGKFVFDLEKTEAQSADVTRFWFDPRKTYYVAPNQIVRVYTGDTLDYAGRLANMPSYIEVEVGGSNWQVGQLLVLPGSIRDTICQVKRIGEGGSIKKLDIIQHGYGNDSDISYDVSPYAYKPETSYTESFTEKISDFPPIYSHNLNIYDINEDIVESITGYQDDQEYVMFGYVLQGYIKRLVLSQNYVSSPASNITNPDITIDQWIKSKARIKIRNAYTAKEAGYYADQRGQISAPTVRLQDNFFYQLFSYVITSSHMLSEYKNVLSLIHPAGVKYFSNSIREVSVSANINVNRVMSRESVIFADQFYVQDDITLVKTLNFYDRVNASTLDVNNNYDANNDIAYYDAGNDWDEITEYTTVYDLNEYDNGTYGTMEPYTGYVDIYSIDMFDDGTYYVVLVSPTYDGRYDAQEYDLAEYTITPLTYIDQYTLEDDTIKITKN